MTIKLTHALLVGLSLIAIMPARAEIASKEYVDAAIGTVPDQVQADWNQSNSESTDYIKNKPTLGTAAAATVETTGVSSNTTTLPTTAQVKTYAEGNFVPQTRTVNGEALSSNVTLDGADIAVTGYSTSGLSGNVAATDTINQAIGKLENKVDGKAASSDVTAITNRLNDVMDNTMEDVIQYVGTKALRFDQGSAAANAIAVTDNNGDVRFATGGVITDDKISSSANIELGKLHFPTPGSDCETKGCTLMYYDGKYVWEVIRRGTNESVSTTGYVSATPTATSSTSVGGHRTLSGGCQNNDSSLDIPTGDCTNGTVEIELP